MPHLIGSIFLPKRQGFASRDTGKGWALKFGGEEEDRTPDLRIANAALSQLSYPPKAGHNISYGAFGNSLIVNDYFRRRTKLVFMRLFS